MDNQIECIKCNYSLRGLDASGKCPECGLDVLQSMLGDDNRRLHAYEERLLERKDRYRSNYKNAIGLGLVQILAAGFVLFGARHAGSTDDTLFFIIASILFGAPLWLLVAYGQYARMKHVESIEHARKKLAKAFTSNAGANAKAATPQT